MNPRATLLELFAAGLTAVSGSHTVYRALLARGKREPCHVIALGKAADAMFEGARRFLHGNIQTALVVTKHGHVSMGTRQFPNTAVLESAHPVPDETSLAAGQALVAYLQALPESEKVIFLISGGTSSLVEVLAPEWDLKRLQHETHKLLANGSSIHDINAMRRSVSQIKGGKLWQFLGNRPVTCLLISDVSGDDPAVIGSGLLFPYPEESDFDWEIIASNQRMLMAMSEQTCELPIHINESFLDGDVVECAKGCIDYLRHADTGIYLWGAETTVKLPENPRRGGRNQHFALAAAQQLQPSDSIYLLAAGTDGTDGVTEDTGGLVDNATIQRGRYENLDPADCLARADAGTFLEGSGDLIHIGPTGTNVMDVVIGLKL